jgi:hypothetical protein
MTAGGAPAAAVAADACEQGVLSATYDYLVRQLTTAPLTAAERQLLKAVAGVVFAA